jgi:hypothetical protein
MHDATKQFNELEGDLKKNPTGEYEIASEDADPQINQAASNAASDRLRA